MYPIRGVSALLAAWSLKLYAALGAGAGALGGSPDQAFPAAPHNVRLTVADGGIEDETLYFKIRFFWDDLQLALMDHTSNMEFRLAETEAVDNVVLDYLRARFVVSVPGKGPLDGVIVQRGIQDAPRADEVMWWYRIEYEVPGSAEEARIQNRLLFNLFEDQRNIVHLVGRGGAEESYAFGWSLDEASLDLR